MEDIIIKHPHGGFSLNKLEKELSADRRMYQHSNNTVQALIEKIKEQAATIEELTEEFSRTAGYEKYAIEQELPDDFNKKDSEEDYTP